MVTGKGWSGTIRVDEALGDVTSVAGGRGMVVAVLSSGEARRWLQGDDESVSLGPAELVLANVRDDTLVWLVAARTAGRRCAPWWRRPNGGAGPSPFRRAGGSPA